MMGVLNTDEHLGFVRVRYLFAQNCELLKEVYGSRVLPSLRPLNVSFSHWRPEFNRRVVHVGFVVDKSAIKQFFRKYFGFVLPIIIRRMFHIRISSGAYTLDTIHEVRP
jgi:hypothetical protein